MSGQVHEIGGRPLTVEDVVAAGRTPTRLVVNETVQARMQAARAVVERYLDENIPAYGLNTGLGGNVGHRVTIAETAGFQERLVLGRMAGIGAPLPVEIARAALFARVEALSRGGAGLSPHVFELLVRMVERDVVPVLPSRGSLGTGDLLQSMPMAGAAMGQGEAFHAGEVLPAKEALRRAGLEPVALGSKDGLAIANASPVTAALACFALQDLARIVTLHVAVAALACEAFGANPGIFDARLVGARPAARQVEAAARFRHALEGSDFLGTKPARVQDALSFRTLPQVTGVVLAAMETARREVEIELNGEPDNPLVLVESGEIHSTANFHTPALALAFDMLAIALSHLATASAQRAIKLMTGRLSGLPNYLSPFGGASAGFVPLQKNLAALQAEIRLKATPASLDALVVSDMAEDVAPMTVLSIGKLSEQLEPLRWTLTLEALVAAQAWDLRANGARLGQGSAVVYEAVRAVVPVLEADRAMTAELVQLYEALWHEVLAERLQPLCSA